jgi:hypothetical protein
MGIFETWKEKSRDILEDNIRPEVCEIIMNGMEYP